VKKNELDYDINDFQTLVSRTSNAYKRATSQYVDLINFWNDLGERHFSGQISFEIDEQNALVSGNASGKRFSIYSSMHYRGNEALLEARVAVNDPVANSEKIVGRFLVSQTGSIHASDGELVLHVDDDLRQYKTLAAVVRRVFGITHQGE